MSKRRIDNVATSIKIRDLIKQHDMTPRQVQEELGLSCVQTIYAWMSPKKKSIPSLDNIVLLSNLFDVEIEEILVLVEI